MTNEAATSLTEILIIIPMIILVALINGWIGMILWNYLAPMYFDFLPAKYLHLPYWHCFCLSWLVGTVFKSHVHITKKP